MTVEYKIVERERSGLYEIETNHFFDVVDNRTQNVVMTFQKEPCVLKNRPRGDWSYWMCFNVKKVEFSSDGKTVLFYVVGKTQPGIVPLP